MALLKGKQIATGADGVATANCVTGLLSADASGRALFAAGVLDSTTFDSAVADSAIALDKMAEAVIQADGGQAFTAAQSMGGFKLTSVAAPEDGTDAANKDYVLSQVVGGRTWKEIVLVSNQLLAGAAGGVLQAMLASIVTKPTATDTFILTNGTTTETFEFVATEEDPFDVAIGASAAESQTNLIAAINDDSTLWSAVATTGLDAYFAATYATQFVVYRTATATSALNDRIYGVQTAPDGIKVVSFAGTMQDYAIDSGTEASIPASDPAAKRFGFGRAIAALQSNEIHLSAEDNSQRTWDTDDQVWQQIDIGAIVYGTAGEMTAETPDVAAAAGSSTHVARIDHVHAAACGEPVAVGTSNAEGDASTFARSNHVHDSPAPTTADKAGSPAAGTGNYQTTGLAITATPALDGYVAVLVNGIGYEVGDGVRTKDCYYSADAGATARAIAAIAAADVLYWNGTIAGFNLATTDEVDQNYLV